LKNKLFNSYWWVKGEKIKRGSDYCLQYSLSSVVLYTSDSWITNLHADQTSQPTAGTAYTDRRSYSITSKSSCTRGLDTPLRILSCSSCHF